MLLLESCTGGGTGLCPDSHARENLNTFNDKGKCGCQQ